MLLGVAAAVLGWLPAVDAAGFVLDQADYVYNPSAPAEPDAAVWQKSGNITPILGADSLVLVDPDSSSSLLYAHSVAQIPVGATASFRVTLRIPSVSDSSPAFDGNVTGGRVILDDGVKRAELQFARDATNSNTRILGLGGAATGQPIPWIWDNNIATTYAIARASDGSMTVTITSSDPTIAPISKTYSPGDLTGTSGQAHFAFGTGDLGGGAFAFSEVHGVISDEVVLVAIDIKPGSDDPATVNLGSAGVIPVAILSSPSFDATQVVPESVSLAGAKVKLIGKAGRYSCATTDVNTDGLLDLLCHVETAQFFLEPGESLAVLEAETLGGRAIRGQEMVRIVP